MPQSYARGTCHLLHADGFCRVYSQQLRNRHLEEINGQFEIIRAVSKIYVTNILVNLKANRLEFLYGAGEFPKYNNRMTAKQAFETVFLHYISEEDREKYREFCDFSTLNSRLGGKEYIEFSYKNLRGEWSTT